MSELAHKPDSTLPIDVTTANNPDTLHGDPFICARKLSDLRNIAYPEGITGIRFDLDTDTENGLFRYDRDFLLQFMPVCKGRPPTLVPLEDIDLAPNGYKPALARAQPRRQAQKEAAPSGQESLEQTLSPGTVMTSNNESSDLLSRQMDYIPAPGSGFASEKAFALRNAAQPASVSGASMETPWMKSLGPVPSRKFGFPKQAFRDSLNAKATVGHTGASEGSALPIFDGNVQATPISHPAVVSFNDASGGGEGAPPLVDVEGSIKAILGNLTSDTFEAVLQRMILLANKSEGEKDGHTLKEVIGIVFEVATTDATMPEPCARLLTAMGKGISHAIQDDKFKKKGRHFVGEPLFRRYVVQRMQDDFDHTRAAEATVPTQVTRRVRRSPNNAVNENQPNLELQRLLLMTFVGELHKKRLFSSSKTARFITKVLNSAKHDRVNVEPLCVLVSAVGGTLKGKKPRGRLDSCMAVIKQWHNDARLAGQTREMLTQTIQLQKRNWIIAPPLNPDGSEISEVVNPPTDGAVDSDDDSDSEAEGIKDIEYIQDGADPIPSTSIWTESVADTNHEDGGNNQKAIVEFLERLVQMRLCSVALLPSPDRPGAIEAIVDEIASHAPDAFRKLTLMIRGGELD